MTISCKCPKCGQLCGFKDIYAGHRARCLQCSTAFIIPEQDGDVGQSLPQEPAGPLPGFYKAVLKENFKAFIQRESIIGLVLCIALTCFHFFIGDKDYSISLPGFRLPLFVGWVVTFITAGYLLWYCVETINTTAFECDFLPDIYIGDGFAFVKEIAKSIYFFIVAFAIALIPAAIMINLLDAIGVSWQWLNTTILILSLTTVPMVLSMLACGIAPWMLFRFDRIFVIITKTLGPYMLTTAITVFAFSLVFLTVGFFATHSEMTPSAAVMLTARLVAVFSTLFAMRTIGLYARHYFDCFPELKVPEY